MRFLGVMGGLLLAGTALGQAVGGACPAGATVGPDVNGRNLQCVSGVWAIASPDIPSGLIAAFASSSCPTGWSEYTAARGRFLRGLDNGAGLDPSGTRVAGGQQGDALQNITGGFKVGGSTGGIDGYSGAFYGASSNQNFPNPGSSAAGVGSAAFNAGLVARTSSETRPVNVAVLFCSKN